MNIRRELEEAKNLLRRWLYAPTNCGPEGRMKLATDTGGYLNRHKKMSLRKPSAGGRHEAADR